MRGRTMQFLGYRRAGIERYPYVEFIDTRDVRGIHPVSEAKEWPGNPRSAEGPPIHPMRCPGGDCPRFAPSWRATGLDGLTGIRFEEIRAGKGQSTVTSPSRRC